MKDPKLLNDNDLDKTAGGFMDSSIIADLGDAVVRYCNAHPEILPVSMAKIDEIIGGGLPNPIKGVVYFYVKEAGIPCDY